MDKYSGKVIVFFVFSFLIFFSHPLAGKTETITIRADEWCPFNCTPGSEKPGYMIELARIIFEEKGHTIDYQAMTWARAIQMTEKGEIDAIVGATKNEAPGFVFPDIPQGYIRDSFFVIKPGSWKYTGVESLEEVNLGVIRGYGYADAIQKYIDTNKNTLKVQEVSGNDALHQNIQKLLKGRIDALTEEKSVFWNTVKEMGIKDKFAFAGSDKDVGEDNYIFIAFSPKNPDSEKYAQWMTQGQTELRKSGKFAMILDKYGLDDWVKEDAGAGN